MNPDFWHRRWTKNEIAFHESAPNKLLTRYAARLGLAPGQRVFLPLCGKTRDIRWLRDQGYQVAGAELSQIAVDQLFSDLGITPEITQAGAAQRYHAPGLDIFVGDFFALTPGTLGPVDAVYDRAALVALPAAMRPRYTQHVMTLAPAAPQLLLCYTYDQSQADGPPFSVGADEVRAHYAEAYTPTLLETTDVAGGLRGTIPATETAWLLTLNTESAKK